MKLVFSSMSGKIVAITVVVLLSALPIWFADSSTDLVGAKAIGVAVLPALLILLYGLTACVYVRKNGSDRGDSLANFTYFLGYLCTITAVTVLVVRLGYIEDDFVNIKTITLAIGMKLTATVAGLVGMILIKGIQEVEPMESGATREIVDRLEGVIVNSRDAFGNLCRECKLTETSLSAMRHEADTLATSIKEYNAASSGGQREFREYAQSIGACVEKIEGLSSSIKKLSEYKMPEDVLKVLGQTIVGVHDLDKKCQAAGATIDGFDRSVKTCSANVGSMGSEVSENTGAMSEFNDAVKELDRVLTEFARLMELRISRAAESTH